jgi:hypothetical protein
VQSVDRRLFHPVVLTHATLSGSNLLSTLTRKLGQPAGGRRDTNLALIESALALLTSASGGLPRSLCLLARAAWIHAATLGAQRIQPDRFEEDLQISSVRLTPPPPPPPPRPVPPPLPSDPAECQRRHQQTLDYLRQLRASLR